MNFNYYIKNLTPQILERLLEDTVLYNAIITYRGEIIECVGVNDIIGDIFCCYCVFAKDESSAHDPVQLSFYAKLVFTGKGYNDIEVWLSLSKDMSNAVCGKLVLDDIDFSKL